jgi:hypothetical protein
MLIALFSAAGIDKHNLPRALQRGADATITPTAKAVGAFSAGMLVDCGMDIELDRPAPAFPLTSYSM